MSLLKTQGAHGLLAGVEAGSSQAIVDRALAAHGQVTGTLPLARILPRPGGDTRAPDPLHVLGLAESMLALGLLEPLVVDRNHHLIAGRNRLEALRWLSIANPEERMRRFGELAGASRMREETLLRVRDLHPPEWLRRPIPVRFLAIDAKLDPHAALAAEVAENEHRRDYTRTEVLTLAARLRAAGFTDRPGRPRRGERPLRPTLAAIVGRHERTIRRLLDDKAPDATAPGERAQQDALRSIRAVRRHAQALLAAIGKLESRAARDGCRAAANALQHLVEPLADAERSIKPPRARRGSNA